MRGTITQGETTTQATPEAVQQVVGGGQFFWLDLDVSGAGGDGEVSTLLVDTFHFHPVAVHAAAQFGQRPRIDDYDAFVHVVTFGMAADGQSVAEVHCFITAGSVVSLHQGACPTVDEVRERVRTHHVSGLAPPQIAIVFLLMDGLVDSFFPVLSDVDDRIDDLENAILKSPTEEQLGTLFEMKRRLMAIRKVVAPQRDMIATLNAGTVEIPGLNEQGAAYFRSLYDHLIRITDQIDSYRDLINGATDTHLSMVSNRLNVVMKQLAVIATVFLPLSFLTGFFGQNFSWMISHAENGAPYFFGIGIGTEVVALVLLFVLFKRRGWLGSGPTA